VAWAAWTIKPVLNRNDEGPGFIPGLFSWSHQTVADPMTKIIGKFEASLKKCLPRTIVEVHRLNQDDIFEVKGTFYAPAQKKANSEPSTHGP
jgi:hypothetical protein